VLVNPTNTPTTEATLRDLPAAARALGLQIQLLNASTSREIEAAFATLVRDRADALFVAPDAFFNTRGVQFATLATRHGIPTALSARELVVAGGLMSYATDNVDMWRQIGVYTGQMVRALIRHLRGEPEACSVIRVPSPEQEDAKRLHRERDRLIAERVAHVNRVKGLCATQGFYDYEPLRSDRLKRLEKLRTGDGRAVNIPRQSRGL
jgi:DNA-binding LacI/PurR family transcriptional regulator